MSRLTSILFRYFDSIITKRDTRASRSEVNDFLQCIIATAL